MPQLEHAAHRDSRIRSHPQRSNGVRKPPTPARFDTVLVEVDPELRRRGGLHGKTNPLLPNVFTHRDYRTLCRRSASHLLASFAHWSLSSTPGVHPWFKLLQAYDENVKMFRFSRSTRQRCPSAETIPVGRIIQNVH